MTILRLLADDLTGALDTAAQFVGMVGPVPVFWNALPSQLGDTAAVDTGTRELEIGVAETIVEARAKALDFGRQGLSYFKIDSLLRGHAGRELARCIRLASVRHCIIAPAFPYQGRVTRGGRQFCRTGEEWRRVGEGLVSTLTAAGISVSQVKAGDAAPDGISLWDAETDEDLEAVVAAGRSLGPDVLWCGSGGLAGAIAGDHPSPILSNHRALSGPLLGLFGTDHAVTAEQLRRAGAATVRLVDGSPQSAELVRTRLQSGAALVTFDLPADASRRGAAERIAANLADLTSRLAPPVTLVAGGGATLRALCRTLDVQSLDVEGQLMPGVPKAVLRGGRWDGVAVISKSGAFGQPDLLHELAEIASCQRERTEI
ncbi:four-carbon acid sugar kinase family protein [Telmatospirillum sp.]|uniref:four-carbon acid sugar kinase family protein n=1 Tax=Telmatospirillum sp. TaxID=2079197 RepID=UPI0028494BDE|nr:four-carbon acid sugar kinase family protein [Telmatospirillum sp.]MDR3440998.1 four-carbon acid sugar kinase family protein [Telmatospirillum sp.]